MTRSKYNTVMEDLMDQYDRAWEKARSEEINLGTVTHETEQLLITIELEMEMLQAAV